MSRFAFSQPEVDPRAFEGMENLDVLRRRELWDLAERIGVPYPQGATAENMREILRSVPHITEAVNQVKQNPDSERPVVEQVVNQFQNPSTGMGERVEGQDDVLLRKMAPFALQAELKKRGLKLPKTTKKPDLLKALGVEDDVPSGG